MTRPSPSTSARARRGYTLVELVVAIALGAIVLTCAFSLLLSARHERGRVRQGADLVTHALEADANLQGDLAEAGRGLFAAPNWAGLQARAGGTSAAPADTLVLTRGLGAPVRVAAAPCPSGDPSCVLVLGNLVGTLAIGDLVLVGGPTTGAGLYIVTGVGDAVTQSCGADCATVALECTDPSTGDPLVDVVVTGSVLHQADGTDVTLTTPCAASAFTDGSWCEETTGPASVGVVTTPTCGGVTAPTTTYTPVMLADRSAALGYPAFSPMTLRSGADGTPQVVLQHVAVVQYFLDTRAAGQSVLAKGMGVRADGEPGFIVPVAGDVTTFAVETQHVGDAVFARGVGVTAAMLTLASSNTNWSEAAGPTITRAVRAWTFARSYQTLAAARVRYTLAPSGPPVPTEAAPPPLALSAVASLTHILAGGTLGPVAAP